MKRFLVLLLLISLMPLAFAAPPSPTVVSSSDLIISSNIPNSIKQNTLREWEIHIVNNTKIIESGITCFLHIYDETNSGGHLYKNQSSTVVTQDIEMVTAPSVHAIKGVYSYKIYCNTSGQAGIYEREYYVTKSGLDPSGDNLTLVIYLLFIIATVGLFYTLFITIAKLVTAEETIYDVLLSWSFFILTIIVNYLGSEYLLRTYIEDLTATFLTVTVWTNGVLPLLAFIITFFVKGMQKKRPLSVSEIGGKLAYG